ncbi:DPP IV N-terminal domain-containing protein [Novosphingobium profundi]|uniref:S9 family peptidase n=1 Tax=Novosphingobium profundi TaxID=1774954 RepID=UPI001BDAF2CC|nr:S9 family peptidase [Novosphingobium profundi]MBT0668602.1 DPP IV N-terminal domain-containing protein [Novosphingobium profundi]
MKTRHLLMAGLCAALPVALPTLSFAKADTAGKTTMSQETTAPTLDFTRVFASPALNGPSPRQVRISPDGRYLTLLRNRDDDRERYDLWGYDRRNGKWRMLVDSLSLGTGRELSEAEKMQRERQRIGDLKGIVDYAWNEDSASLMVPLDGDLYLAGLDGKVTRLTNDAGDELNPALSPAGTYVSYVRDGRLMVGRTGKGQQAITPEEASDTVHWGEAEFVAQEEMDRMTGYWWAPGEAHIAVERYDEAPVGVVQRAAIGAEGTKIYAQRYPAAGTPNVEVALYVMKPDGSARVKVDLGSDPDIYLARVNWARDGKTLYVQRENRVQDRLDMLAVDPETGASTVLFTETAAKGSWINLTNNYRFLKDGSLVWWSERSGFGHLYRFAKGKWAPLTHGNWEVSSLVGVDEKAGRVIFTGTKDDVLAPQVYSVDLAHPGEPKRLTEMGWANGAVASKDASTLVVSRSSTDQPPQSYIADGTGKRLAWVEENRLDASHPYAPYMASHRETTFGTVKAEDGSDLHWMMITPKLEPGKKYPVFFEHYGGPHVQTVSKAWLGALPQAIVDKGFIYFRIDNRGSAHRGVDFEKQIHEAMGTVEVADQKAGALYLKSLAYVDPGKIVTYGWSYGGYMTLKMLEADQGLYAAGISGAPVTKWELYDSHYTERYMGDPRQVPEAYKASDALENAPKIADPLLLIHGMADDNVVFENSTALAAKLQNEAKPFEMMFYPGHTHAVKGPKISVHVWDTIFAFLARHGITGVK